MRLRFLRRIAVVVVCASGLSFAEQANNETAAKTKGLPIELAFSRKQLRRSDRPTTSPDRRWFAYEVLTPPVRSPESESKAGRFLPNGTPSDTVGTGIEIVATSGGPSRRVCKDGVTCWRPSWSKDSKYLAFYSDRDGVPQLWVYDTTRGQARRVSQTAIKAKLWSMDRPAWSNDSAEVFVPILPQSRAEQPTASAKTKTSAGGPTVTVYRTAPEKTKSEAASSPTGLPDSTLLDFLMRENNATLASIDLATGKARIIVPAEVEPRPSSLKLSPDGKWMSYLSVFRLKAAAQTETFYDLVLVPARGGAPIVVEPDLETTDRDYYDEPYLWSRDGKQIVFTKKKRVWAADISDKGVGKPRQLGDKIGELNEYPFLLTGDGRAVLVGLKPKEEQGYYTAKSAQFALVPLDGSTVKTFSASGQPVNSSVSTLWQPNPKLVYFFSDEDNADRALVEIDPEAGTSKKLWQGRARISAAGVAADGTLLVRFENNSTAPDYFRLKRDYSGVDRLTLIEPKLGDVLVGPVESFEVAVPYFDGRLNNARPSVFLPPGYKKGTRLPTIIYFYAGSAFSEYAQDFGGGAPNSIPVQLFATRGYAVLFVDVPLGPQGTAGNPIQEMTDAILPQIYRAADLGYVDINRVAIMGQSYGAYSTMGIVAQTNLFRAAIALDGVYDLPGGFARMYPDGGAINFLWSESGQARMGTHPWADLKRYLGNSPYYLADKIHTPVLLIHGEKDDACPVEEAKKMFNALKRLNRTAELAVYAGEGHVPGEWSLVNAVDASERMLAFLETALTRAEN
jgi:dipeptidyl aminopeptidase/acylaminoacyl peptidase